MYSNKIEIDGEFFENPMMDFLAYHFARLFIERFPILLKPFDKTYRSPALAFDTYYAEKEVENGK